MILLRASARKLHDFSSMTHNSPSPARDSAETLYSTGQVKYTVKATWTQVREFLFFWELLRQMSRWFLFAGFLFRGDPLSLTLFVYQCVRICPLRLCSSLRLDVTIPLAILRWCLGRLFLQLFPLVFPMETPDFCLRAWWAWLVARTRWMRRSSGWRACVPEAAIVKACPA